MKRYRSDAFSSNVLRCRYQPLSRLSARTSTRMPPTSTRLVFTEGSRLSRDSLGVATVGVELRSPSSGREGTVIFSVRLAACTRSEERRVGKEWVGTGRSGWWAYPEKNKQNQRQ